jgi:hypothetical protein
LMTALAGQAGGQNQGAVGTKGQRIVRKRATLDLMNGRRLCAVGCRQD